MAVTPSEWALLRALAWHRVMLVRRGDSRASVLRLRNLLSMDRPKHSAALLTIRVTAAGLAMAAKIEEELSNVNSK